MWWEEKAQQGRPTHLQTHQQVDPTERGRRQYNTGGAVAAAAAAAAAAAMQCQQSPKPLEQSKLIEITNKQLEGGGAGCEDQGFNAIEYC